MAPRPGGIYIDGTLGGGGHAAAVLGRAQPGGRLLGIDADPAALVAADAHLSATGLPPESYQLIHGCFAEMAVLAQQAGFAPADGIMLDLGVSSPQLDRPERGFSFNSDGPLDMRMDPTHGPTAADLVAELGERELADLIFRYGEERNSRRIARLIVERRMRQPFTTTADLAAVVARVGRGRHERIHPATRTFQALRIVVNQELEQLEAALPQAVSLLNPGGRLAVISFHSLEDRIVKHFFRTEAGYREGDEPERAARLRIITRKPAIASDTECVANPRSRSAKLRVAEKV